MKARKSLEAHNQFQSGWVGSVLLYKPSNEVNLFLAEVTRSQAVNDEKHKPWVAVAPDGGIICAHCNCMAG